MLSDIHNHESESAEVLLTVVLRANKDESRKEVHMIPKEHEPNIHSSVRPYSF